MRMSCSLTWFTFKNESVQSEASTEVTAYTPAKEPSKDEALQTL